MALVNSARTVNARFGGLAQDGWGVLLPASRRYRKRLGLSDGGQLVIDQLLYHHRKPNEWRSFSQKRIAEELGIGRATLNEQLTHLRRLGFVATRADTRHGTRTPPLFYCLDPYLAALAMLDGIARLDRTLWTEGEKRLYRFGIAADDGAWEWGVDKLRTPANPAVDIFDLFVRRYGLSDGPRSEAVLAMEFIRDDSLTLSSVPPTEAERHIHAPSSGPLLESASP